MTRKTSFRLLTGVALLVAALWPSAAAAQANPEEMYSVAYPDSTRLSGRVRVLAQPKQADVYVDGFFAGVVDDFNGTLQRLPITPGNHAVTLYCEGYRTVTRHIAVVSDATVTVRLKMKKIGPDQISELPPPPLSEAPAPR